MLLGELDLNAAPAVSALAHVDTKFSGTMSALGSIGAGAGAAMAGLAAAFAVIAAAGAGLHETLDFAGKLNDESLRTGESAGALTILGEAFKEAGLGADGAEPFLLKLQSALGGVNEEGGETADAFNALGVSAEQLNGLDSIGQIEALQKGFAGIADQATKVQVARDLFGKSGGQALSLLGDPHALDDARKKAGPLADLMDVNTAAFDKLGDSIGALKIDFLEFSGGALSAIAPELTKFTDTFGEIDFLGIGEAVGGIANKVLQLGEAFLSIAPAINWASEKLSDLFGSGSHADAGFGAKFSGLAKVGAPQTFGGDNIPVSALQKIGLNAGGGYGGGDPLLSESRRQTNLLQRIADATSRSLPMSSVPLPV